MIIPSEAKKIIYDSLELPPEESFHSIALNFFDTFLFPKDIQKASPLRDLEESEITTFPTDFEAWHKKLTSILEEDEISLFDIQNHLKEDIVNKWLGSKEFEYVKNNVESYAAFIALAQFVKENENLELIPDELSEPLSPITYFELFERNITPEITRFLSALKGLTSLKFVHCTFQEISLQKLKDTLPDCKVEID